MSLEFTKQIELKDGHLESKPKEQGEENKKKKHQVRACKEGD